jgi:hypothetical protein
MIRGIEQDNRANNAVLADMQYAVATYLQTLQKRFVNLEKVMAQMHTQNAVVAAYASGMHLRDHLGHDAGLRGLARIAAPEPTRRPSAPHKTPVAL